MARPGFLLLLPLLVAASPPMPHPGAPRTVEDQLGIARRRLARGAYRSAARAFRRALDESPGSPEARLGLGEALAWMGRCDDALGYLREVRRLPVWDADGAVAEGECAMRLGDDATAEAAWTEARLLGDATYAVYGLGQLAHRRGDDAAARDAADALEDADDGETMAVLLRTSLAADGGGDDAWEALREAREDVGTPGGRLQLGILEGQLWLDAGDPVEAERVLTRAIATSRSARARVEIAEAERRLGRPEIALADLADGFVAGPDTPLADAIAARARADRGDLSGAQSLLDENPRPRDPDVLASRWYVARLRGDEAGARTWAGRWREAERDHDATLDALLVDVAGGNR